MDLVGTIRRCS